MWYDRTFSKALQNHFPLGGFEGYFVSGVAVTITGNRVRCNGIDVFESGRWFARVPKLRSYLLTEVLRDNRVKNNFIPRVEELEEIFG